MHPSLPLLGGDPRNGLLTAVIGCELMRRSFDFSAVDRPTILEIWTPTCVECRAMKPDVDEMAETFSDRVDLKMVSAAEDPETVRGWAYERLPL